MNEGLLITLGFISTLPAEQQEAVKACKAQIMEAIRSHEDGIGVLALALVGMELQEEPP